MSRELGTKEREGSERGGTEDLEKKVKIQSRVVMVEGMSPPSPPDSMAALSIVRDLDLVGGSDVLVR